ncbi:hypothetical protein pneo_cds_482 [Pandoravirus neocaledonia]|uniref:Uncharacterized protein n=1 Tax=Pandoravirus neocaledonia TaxID=2107708 RepID=A0A2U7UC99_9VIRU|nr:hypothetical protein pneo_cds_482 [Pandoravirus neocaledonia]AVK76089.1 hypothetical protein pneo_cds_482 [Pandoravirus neocaledonia]
MKKSPNEIVDRLPSFGSRACAANSSAFCLSFVFFFWFTLPRGIGKKTLPSMSMRQTAAADGPHAATLTTLSVEIRCRILGLLPTASMARARLAHRRLAVQGSDRTRASRQEAVWLRTSPKRACALGRTDVITYLYKRKRIPRTIDLTRVALFFKEHGHGALGAPKVPALG